MPKKKQNIEYEVKVLDIDKEQIIQKLRELGAKEQEESLMRRWDFDPENNRFIRLRDNGQSVTLTYKSRPTASTPFRNRVLK